MPVICISSPLAVIAFDLNCLNFVSFDKRCGNTDVVAPVSTMKGVTLPSTDHKSFDFLKFFLLSNLLKNCELKSFEPKLFSLFTNSEIGLLFPLNDLLYICYFDNFLDSSKVSLKF